MEINPKQRQEVQESFDRHIKDTVDGSITGVQMSILSHPAVYHNGHPIQHMPGKRTFTYDGYTQAGKRFSLTIDE